MNTFEFLKEYDKDLYDIAKQINSLLYEHPTSAATQMRIFIEKMIDKIIKIENINKYDYNEKSLYEKINALNQNYLEDDIIAKLHLLRKFGNGASHGEDIDLEESLLMHKEIFDLAIWFIESYKDFNFVEPRYTPPKKAHEKYDLYKNISGSHLLYQLSRLSKSSSEAVIGAKEFNDFKKYLHVDTKIKEELEEILQRIENGEENKLILLCGSVGDGKSHLISYLNNFKSSLLKDFYIHNDATASFNPKETDIDTLYKLLDPYKDSKIKNSDKNILLAINLGVLNKFLENNKSNEFKKLENFINRSKLFDENESTENIESKYFEIINFTDYFPFSLQKDGPKAKILETLFEKISAKSKENPFYLAYSKDENKKEFLTILNNYKILKNEFFQSRIINLIIKVIVKEKKLISIRDLLDLLYSIIVPPNYNKDNVINNNLGNDEIKEEVIEDKLGNHLVNLIFDYPNRSEFLEGLKENDPFDYSNEMLDNKILSLSNANDIYDFFETNLDVQLNHLGLNYLKELNDFKSLNKSLQILLIKTYVRLFYFFDEKSNNYFDDKQYEKFTKSLFAFYSGQKYHLMDIQNKLLNAINLWNGSVPSNEDYKYMDSNFNKIKIAQKLNIESYTNHINKANQDIVKKFKLYLELGVRNKNNKEEVAFINVDYPLYTLIEDINRGYIPNSFDKEESIKLVNFIDKVMGFGNSDEEILLDDLEDDSEYIFSFNEAFEYFNFREC
ncbi:MAG: DNA phosphorothioation-dependent restriction protein DptF [Bacillota bacterium]